MDMDVFLNICLCIMCVSGAQGGQKRTLGPLGLELKMVVNHHVAAEN